MIIVQIILPTFACGLNNLSDNKVKARATQNKVVLKIEIFMVSTPFVIL